MPEPASRARQRAASLFGLYRQLHGQLRDELAGLDDDVLNWVPAPEANSVATIVTHLVGSEAETLRCVAGVGCGRDREAEFAGSRLTGHDVMALLDGADSLLDELEPRIDDGRLDAVFALPTLPAEERRRGLTWLVGNYGHAREHLGQAQLTTQLYRQARSPTS